MKTKVTLFMFLCMIFSLNTTAQNPTETENPKDPEAQFQLGSMYRNGQAGKKKDIKQTVYWWTLAAEQNHAYAQAGLGELYLGVEGVKRDMAKSEYWRRKAAEQGNAIDSEVLYMIGRLYCYGEAGKKIDRKRTLYWWSLAAEQNHVLAQTGLGALYMSDGNGVKRDMGNSEYWSRKAAEQGSAFAQYLMGFIYEVWKNNKGVAIYWYQKAADQGNEDAIGRLYELRGGY